MTDPTTHLRRARIALEGVSVGDAPSSAASWLRGSVSPASPQRGCRIASRCRNGRLRRNEIATGIHIVHFGSQKFNTVQEYSKWLINTIAPPDTISFIVEAGRWIMKLAEALVERKAAQDKLRELSERLQRAAVVQEGERPAEEPAVLLAELDEVAARLEDLILAINRTNSVATLPNGRTLTAAIARRDVLRMRQGVIDALLRSVGSPQFRARGAEIKFVPTVAVPELQVRRDALAKEYRELDTAIQAANWAIELSEG